MLSAADKATTDSADAHSAAAANPRHHTANPTKRATSMDDSDATDATALDATATSSAAGQAADKLRYRVKLYELLPPSLWEDRGTGFCQIVYVEVRVVFTLAHWLIHDSEQRFALYSSPLRVGGVAAAGKCHCKGRLSAPTRFV
jgi:hypothetical protein